jgi:hypothetical protein
MARIRTVKPEFFRHEGLFDAERETGLPLRVAFAGLWTAADREGRFEWRPRQLKLDCLPHDDVDFSRVLDALATRGFIQKYTVAGVAYGCIPSWHDHQVINNRESASQIPAFAEDTEEQQELTRAPRVNDACATPLVQVQAEGKGREGKESPSSGDDALNADFDVWWSFYPRKVSKGEARRAYRSARKKTDAETLLAGCRLFQAQCLGKDPQYVAHAATWLNGERWLDQPDGRQEGSRADDDTFRRNLRGWFEMGAPKSSMKHPPGHPECKIPKHIQLEFKTDFERHGYEVAA